MKALNSLIIAAFFAAVMASTNVAAQAPTPEELQQLQDLTPEERARIIDALAEGGSQNQPPLDEPTVVVPRDVSASAENPDGLPTEETAELQPFGYDLFAGEPSTFAPATDIPVPVDYVIGPGDTIELQLFGNQNSSHTLVVTREGVLNFPELGPITVAGMRFSDMQETLQRRVGEQLIGVRSSISMGRLRSIRIFVLGDAHRPGSYTVSALTTMTNALFVSGGVDPIGSLRNVQLKRNGQVVTTLDLYDLLLRGDTSGDARLQPGDVIFIPPVGKTVGIDGEVRRPAIYELRNERTAEEVIALAGGMLATAYPEASQIERINNRRERTILDIDLSSNTGLSTTLSGNDVIRVYSVLEKREDVVHLVGRVFRDGAYQWLPGMRLSELLPSLKDLRPSADPRYVVIRREIPGTLNIEILSSDLVAALSEPGSEADTVLQARDRILVLGFDASRTDAVGPLLDELRQQANSTEPTRIVTIAGRVRSPGQYPLEAGMTISDLVRAGGDLAEEAFVLDAELTRYTIVADEYRGTDVIAVDLDGILDGDHLADFPLSEHDFLRINTVPDWNSEWSVTLDGEVRFPGEYRIRRGESLRQILERAGGLTDEAFAQGAIFLRESLRQKEQDQIDMLAQRLEADLASLSLEERNSSETTSLETGGELLSQLRGTQAVGRLVIDLDAVAAKVDEGSLIDDIELRDGDRLLVPTQSQVVTVIGETQQNVSHLFQPGLSRDDYIALSGGITRRADKKLIYVVRASGAVVGAGGSSIFRRSSNVEMRPGDTIVVPLEVDRLRPLTFWTSVTQILYQSAIAVAAVRTFNL
jgi:protein involved in polysaccharide export with SLBB domain